MLERINELKLDAGFTDKFYEFNEEKSFSVNVDFPLPPAAEMLQEYFTSPEGEQFKKGLSSLIDQLAAWAAQNGLNATPCQKFKDTYVGYSGSQEGVNKNYITFYQLGVSALAGIVDLLGAKNISLEFRKDKVRNLLGSIQVCAPGTHTNITDTYLELLASSNLALRWVAQRRKISEQLVLELLKPMNLGTGMEIHYVNAVLNRYADALAINMIQDTYVSLCRIEPLDTLCQSFQRDIHKVLTAEKVLECTISESELNLQGLRPEKFNDQLKRLEYALNQYGTEKEGKAFYAMHKLFAEVDGEVYTPIKPSWHANYIIYSSLLNRLKRSGYINLNMEVKKIPAEQVSLHLLPGRSLHLAYVTDPLMPFIPYCVNLLSGDEVQRKHFMQILLEYKLSREQAFEVVGGILKYINSVEFDSRNDKGVMLPQLVKTIHEVMLSDCHWYEIVSALPDNAKRIYLDGFASEKIPELIKDIDHLIFILKFASIEVFDPFMRSIAVDILQPVRTDLEKFIRVLSVLDESQRMLFLDAFDKNYPNIISAIVKGVRGLLRILKLLPPAARADCLLRMGPEAIVALKPNGYDLAEIVELIPLENRAVYLFKLAPEFLRESVSPGYVTELMLSKLPKENRYAFLRILGVGEIQKLLTEGRTLYVSAYFSQLPECNRMAFLQDLGLENLLKILTVDQIIMDFLPSLDVADKFRLLLELKLQERGYFVSLRNVLKLLEQFPEKSRMDVLPLKVISLDVFRENIESGYDLFRVMRLFPIEKRSRLINELGLVFLCDKLQIRQELTELLGLLPIAGQQDILRKLIKNMSVLIVLLKTQPKSALDLIFGGLGSVGLVELIKDADGLNQVLKELPVASVPIFVKTLGDDGILALIPNYKALKIVNKCSAIRAFHEAITQDLLKKIIKSDAQAFRANIESRSDFFQTMQLLSPDERVKFVEELGISFLCDKLQITKELMALLELLPAAMQQNLLPELIKDVTVFTRVLKTLSALSFDLLFSKLGSLGLVNIIKDADGLNQVLQVLPKTAVPVFIKALGDSGILTLVPDCKALRKVNVGVADAFFAFHDAITPALLKTIIKSIAQFESVYRLDVNFLNKKHFAKFIDVNNNSFESLQTLIPKIDELIYVLRWITPAEGIKLLDKLGNPYIFQLILKEQRVSDALRKIYMSGVNREHTDALILALVRAYKEQRTSDERTHLHWYGRLFGAPTREQKIAVADKLDAAIRNQEFNYFSKMPAELQNAAQDGSLGQIVHFHGSRLLSS